MSTVLKDVLLSPQKSFQRSFYRSFPKLPMKSVVSDVKLSVNSVDYLSLSPRMLSKYDLSGQTLDISPREFYSCHGSSPYSLKTLKQSPRDVDVETERLFDSDSSSSSPETLHGSLSNISDGSIDLYQGLFVILEDPIERLINTSIEVNLFGVDVKDMSLFLDLPLDVLYYLVKHHLPFIDMITLSSVNHFWYSFLQLSNPLWKSLLSRDHGLTEFNYPLYRPLKFDDKLLYWTLYLNRHYVYFYKEMTEWSEIYSNKNGLRWSLSEQSSFFEEHYRHVYDMASGGSSFVNMCDYLLDQGFDPDFPIFLWQGLRRCYYYYEDQYRPLDASDMVSPLCRRQYMKSNMKCWKVRHQLTHKFYYVKADGKYEALSAVSQETGVSSKYYVASSCSVLLEERIIGSV